MTREALLEQADEALEQGSPDACLALLAELPEADGERALLAAEAHLLRDEVAAAEAELRVAQRELGELDEDVLWMWSGLHLRCWRLAEARARLELYLAARGRARWEPEDARWLDRLALCLDHAGDFAGADAHAARAARLAPEQFGAPLHLAEAELDAVIARALARLPERYGKLAERVQIVIEPVPAPPADPLAPDEVAQPDLLGLFEGDTLHDLAEDSGPRLPPRITLFQRNLERAARGRAELEAEIETTLFHELGHFLGLDEDEVDALGLG